MIEQQRAARVPDGTYTIVGPHGGHRTLSLSSDTSWMTRPPVPGTRILGAVLTGDNERPTSIGVVYPDGAVSMWRRFEERNDLRKAARFLLAGGLARAIEAGKAYAIRSGRCMFCRRKLTTPESVHFGYGPDCAEQNGLPYERVTVASKPGRVQIRDAGWTTVVTSPGPVVGFVPTSGRTYQELFGDD